MQSDFLNLCDLLFAAAANGVYQGMVIAVLVGLALRLVRRTNAATRHAVWLGTLLLLVALVVAHCVVAPFQWRPAASKEMAPPSGAALAMAPADAVVLPAQTEAKAESRSSHSAHAIQDASSTEHPQWLVALVQAQFGLAQGVPQPDLPNEAPPGLGPSDAPELASSGSSAATNVRWLLERLQNPISVELAVGPTFSTLARILLVLGLLFAGLRILTLIAQLVRIRKWKHQSLPPGAELSELFQRLSARLVTNRKVALRVSPAHRSTFVLGFLHPVVLLPADEPMELAETELVLRHELAHVERRDDWVNLLQHVLLALFFFHPALWWISRQLSLEREIACDDHVLEQSKRPQAYALVLANLAARMQKRLPLLASGSSNNKTQLKERIDMILNTHRNTSPRPVKAWLALITSTAAFVALVIIGLAPRIVLAQAQAAPSADVRPVLPVTDEVSVGLVLEAPHAGSADNAPPPPPRPAVVGAGPRMKGGGSYGLSASPALAVPPASPYAPRPVQPSAVAAVPAPPARIHGALDHPSEPPPPSPRPAPAPRAENRDASLEERLERLERMVYSLMHPQNSKGRANYQLKLEKDGTMDRKEITKIEALAKEDAELALKIHPQEIEKIKEHAEREAKRAIEHSKRATAEAEKAHKAEHKQTGKKLKADSQRQLEALRKQMEALERERDKLDREIERLEEDQEKLEEHFEDSVEVNESKRD